MRPWMICSLAEVRRVNDPVAPGWSSSPGSVVPPVVWDTGLPAAVLNCSTQAGSIWGGGLPTLPGLGNSCVGGPIGEVSEWAGELMLLPA